MARSSSGLPRLPGFVLDAELGAGGFATVYRGHRESDSVVAAIKVARADVPAARDQLVHEAQLLQKLDGAGAPSVLGFEWLDPELAFLALELIPLPTLDSVLRARARPLSGGDLLTAARSVVGCFAEIHRRCIAQ